MSELEKIQQYIDKTYFFADRHQMNILEMNAFHHFIRQALADAILWAFNYGCAKGYRAAKAQSKDMEGVPVKSPA